MNKHDQPSRSLDWLDVCLEAAGTARCPRISQGGAANLDFQGVDRARLPNAHIATDGRQNDVPWMA